MFNKRINNVERELDLWKKELQDFMNDIVFCKKCGVAIKKDKANIIKLPIPISMLTYVGTTHITEIYCDHCVPKYDEVIQVGKKLKYYKDHVEVTEKGKIIK